MPWNPKVNSGTIDGWATRWFPNDAQQSLPGDLASATVYSGGRVTEWKMPLASSTAPKVGGAIDVGDGNSYTYPVDLVWSNPATFVAVPVVLVPMSEFEIDKASINFGNPSDDKVSVKGTLQLDLASGEVDISEDVTVTVGPLTEIILGGAMVEKGGKWECKDVGIIKKMKIDWNKGKFEFSMDNADLSGLTSPVTISLQVGDDLGTATIQMTETKRWDYKAPK